MSALQSLDDGLSADNLSGIEIDIGQNLAVDTKLKLEVVQRILKIGTIGMIFTCMEMLVLYILVLFHLLPIECTLNIIDNKFSFFNDTQLQVEVALNHQHITPLFGLQQNAGTTRKQDIELRTILSFHRQT